MSRSTAVVLAIALGAIVRSASAQTILQPPFDVDYSIVDLGAVPSLPPPAGGLTFKPGDPNTLLIGGAANTLSGKIYSIGITRDAGQHVNGFTGTATLVSDAHGIGSGGIDGGLSYGPGGVLFYTSYSDNSLGQIKPGSAVADRQDALTALGITSSVGALAFVPAGFPGAGRMKLAQYNFPGNWYDVTLGAADVNGTYPVVSATLKATIGSGPEGVIYVSGGNPQIAADSVLVSEYSGGSVAAYEIDANGDPVFTSRRVFISGLTGAEGALVDPITGDFLFSTFGGGNRVIVVRGFIAPTTTTTSTTTSTVPSTSSTSTAVPTTTTSSTTTSTIVIATTTSTTSSTSSSTSSSSTTSSSIASTSSSSSTTAHVPTTTTTTVPTGDCALVPAGPTFESIECRLAALRDETGNEPALGDLGAKVLVPLDKAVDRTDSAHQQCAAGGGKKPKAQLKQVARALIQYSHRLRGRSAKKHVDEAILNHLAAAADAIQNDVKAFRTSMKCPQDA